MFNFLIQPGGFPGWVRNVIELLILFVSYDFNR